MMEQHCELWISWRAVPGPPYTDYWTPTGAVFFLRANGSVVELVRLSLKSFELADEGVASLIGLELARLAVDICHPELMIMRWDLEQREQRSNKYSLQTRR